MEKKVLVAREFRDSSLRENERSEFSWQSKQNNLHEVQTESRPIRGAKNRIQTSSSASADFLLESEKRGSPPKSEKRQLLARRGSGAWGAALLREKTSESKGKEIVGDSRIAKIDCFGQSPRNDNILLDSSATLSPQNDESIDCFGDESPRNDRLFDSTNRTRNDKFILIRSKF